MTSMCVMGWGEGATNLLTHQRDSLWVRRHAQQTRVSWKSHQLLRHCFLSFLRLESHGLSRPITWAVQTNPTNHSTP